MTENSPYRSMSDAVMDESDVDLSPVQGCTSSDHDEQFVLTDRRTGRPLVRALYRIEGPGILVEGRTDEQGRTERIHTAGRAKGLVVHQIEETMALSGDSTDADGCL
jgi:hypothetical protein